MSTFSSSADSHDLSKLVGMAEESRSACEHAEKELRSLSLHRQLEEEWSGIAAARDQERKNHCSIQELRLSALLVLRRHLEAALAQVREWLKENAAHVELRQRTLLRVPDVSDWSCPDALGPTLACLVQAAHSLNRAWADAVEQIEAVRSIELGRETNIRRMLQAQNEDIVKIKGELMVERQLLANREAAELALCQLKSLTSEVHSAKSLRARALEELHQVEASGVLAELPQKRAQLVRTSNEYESLQRCREATYATILQLSVQMATTFDGSAIAPQAFPELPLRARRIMHPEAVYEQLDRNGKNRWDMQHLLTREGVLVHDRSYGDSYCDMGEIAPGKPSVQLARLRGAVNGNPMPLKVLKEYGLSDRKNVERAITAANKLKHPGIVPVECAFLEPMKPVVVVEMPWLAGGNLRGWCSDKDPEARLRVAQQVSEAMQFLHAHNHLHRDIKPENIVMTSEHENARPLLCDFDLCIKSSESNSTVLRGTPLYAPPDNAPSKEADIFSLGVTLCDLLFCKGNLQLLRSWLVNGALDRSVNLEQLMRVRTELKNGQASITEITELMRNSRDGVGTFVSAMLAYPPNERPTAERVAFWFSHLLDMQWCFLCLGFTDGDGLANSKKLYSMPRLWHWPP